MHYQNFSFQGDWFQDCWVASVLQYEIVKTAGLIHGTMLSWERERERVGSECVPVTRVIQISGICKTSQDSAVLALKYLKCWGENWPVSFMLKQDVQKGPFKAGSRPTEGGPWTLNKIQVKQRWRITSFLKICLEFGYFLSFMLAQHALPSQLSGGQCLWCRWGIAPLHPDHHQFLGRVHVFMTPAHWSGSVCVVFLVKRSKDTRDNETKQFLLCKSMDF